VFKTTKSKIKLKFSFKNDISQSVHKTMDSHNFSEGNWYRFSNNMKMGLSMDMADFLEMLGFLETLVNLDMGMDMHL